MEFTVSNKFTNSEHIYLRNCDTHTTEKYIYYEKNSILYSVCVMYIVFCTSIQIVKGSLQVKKTVKKGDMSPLGNPPPLNGSKGDICCLITDKSA